LRSSSLGWGCHEYKLFATLSCLWYEAEVRQNPVAVLAEGGSIGGQRRYLVHGKKPGKKHEKKKENRQMRPCGTGGNDSVCAK